MFVFGGKVSKNILPFKTIVQKPQRSLDLSNLLIHVNAKLILIHLKISNNYFYHLKEGEPIGKKYRLPYRMMGQLIRDTMKQVKCDSDLK